MSEKSLDIKALPDKLAAITDELRRYIVITFIIGVGLLYAFLIMRTNQLAQSEPADDAVAERFEATTRPKIDEESAARLEALEDQNIQVQTLFNEARDNPFSE